MIEIRDIHKGFHGKAVHTGLTFEVHDKETTVILGRSGGGKSVLLKMVLGLIKPDSGSILVDGRDITSLTYEQLRDLRFNFGFLFQGAALFDSMTVAENIALPLRRNPDISNSEIDARIRESLDLVGLDNVENLLPSSLSGGMKKRVGLARAIAPRPKYMMYDEPVTGLDVRTADSINILINDMRDKLGVTSIVVTHNINTAFFVGNRLAIFDNGKVLLSGTKDDIRNSDNEEVRKYIKSKTSSAEAH